MVAGSTEGTDHSIQTWSYLVNGQRFFAWFCDCEAGAENCATAGEAMRRALDHIDG